MVYSGSGGGTSESPYLVTTWGELNEVRDYLTAHFRLVNELNSSTADYSSYSSGFTPISTFNGTFDGNDLVIRDLVINTSLSGVGLFGDTGTSCVVKDLSVLNANVTNATFVTGILFGYLNGYCENCNVSGNVTAGNIITGGFCGRLVNGYIYKCYADVTIIGTDRCGGFVGNTMDNNSKIEECYSTGSISCGGVSGGFVGLVSSLLHIKDSYTHSAVNGTGTLVGGFCGEMNAGVIQNCYSIGSVSGSSSVGGFGGGMWSTVTDCYWDTETSGQATTGQNKGTGKTTAEMQNISTYTPEWNIVTKSVYSGEKWFIDTSNYPQLSFEYSEPAEESAWGVFDKGTYDKAEFDSIDYIDNVSSLDAKINDIYKIYKDSVNVTDLLDYNFLIYLFLNDNINVFDVELRKNIINLLTDNIAILDNMYKSVGYNVLDNVSVTDLIAKKPIKILNESLNLSDDIKRNISVVLDDIVNAIDDFDAYYYIFRSFVEVVSTIDALNKKSIKNVDDDVNVADTITRKLDKLCVEIVNILDEFEKIRGRTLTDSVSVKDYEVCLNRISGVIGTIQQDLRAVMFDIMNEQVQLVKVNETNPDGFVDNIEEYSFCIQCRLVPINQKDRNMFATGTIISGMMTGYFLPTYRWDGVDWEVEEGDLIDDTKTGSKYRITKIVQREHLNNKVVYIKGLLQRL